jgi:NAD(P)H-hydrate repair Nnr-like enzyme with NAD(P)H-hydrate epimerase domain
VSRGLTLRAAGAAVLAVVAFAAAGCGSKTLDQGDEVNLVNKQLSSQGLKAKSVDCPSDVEAKEGDTFKCDVTLTNGKTGTYTIKITQVSGSNASLQIVGAQSTGK